MHQPQLKLHVEVHHDRLPAALSLVALSLLQPLACSSLLSWQPTMWRPTMLWTHHELLLCLLRDHWRRNLMFAAEPPQHQTSPH